MQQIGGDVVSNDLGYDVDIRIGDAVGIGVGDDVDDAVSSIC